MTSPRDQTESALTGLRLFFSGLPICGTLIAIWVMRGYSLTEARAHEIRVELDTRRAAKPRQRSRIER